jgi:uncharacterized protein YbcI
VQNSVFDTRRTLDFRKHHGVEVDQRIQTLKNDVSETEQTVANTRRGRNPLKQNII